MTRIIGNRIDVEKAILDYLKKIDIRDKYQLMSIIMRNSKGTLNPNIVSDIIDEFLIREEIT